jgi:hypothetical protein
MDQTGVHLVPSSSYTYEREGASSVAVIGAEDKRQITVCLASSMDGDLLPLQLIFQGKTPRCLPDSTPASVASQFHLTFSENHWSSQATMQQYISEVIMPYVQRKIDEHRLRADSKIILVLDVWAVHKSEEFRLFLRMRYPRIHLVFVPGNCTSKLQVADVTLQRPFKAGVTSSFNLWAVQQVREQIKSLSPDSGKIPTLDSLLKMSVVKPRVVQWTIDSWSKLRERRDLIIDGWKKCCLSLFDVLDPEKQREAVEAVARQELEVAHVPAEEEQGAESESDQEESEDELDLALPVPEGKRSTRLRQPAVSFGYQLNSGAIAMSEDSN